MVNTNLVQTNEDLVQDNSNLQDEIAQAHHAEDPAPHFDLADGLDDAEDDSIARPRGRYHIRENMGLTDHPEVYADILVSLLPLDNLY